MFKYTRSNGKNYLISKLLVLLISFISFIYSSLFFVAPAFAHRPHHVVIQVRMSSSYETNQTVFIIVRHNLFKSVDGGKSWQRILNGLTGMGRIIDLSGNNKNDKVMYITSDFDGVYKTEDGGNSWFPVNNGLDTLILDKIYVDHNSEQFVLVAGNDKKLYKTDDGGNNWQGILTADANITSILITENQGTIIAGDGNGNVYVSSDKGKQWQKSSYLAQKTGAITAIAESITTPEDNEFFVGTAKKGLYKTTDAGKSFTEINKGLSDPRITSLLMDQSDNIFATTWDEGFFVSSDHGESWSKQIQGLTKDAQAEQLKLPNFQVLAQSKNTLFLGGFNGLFKSEDLGKKWQPLETLSLGTVVAYSISPNYSNDQTLAIVTYVGNFYRSEDSGKTWTPHNKGLEILRLNPNYVPYKSQHPRRFFDVAFSPNYGNDNTIFSSLLWTQVATSYDKGESWNPVAMPNEVRGLQLVPSPNFANDKTIYVANQQGLIFKSTNAGKNFSVVSNVDRVPGNDPPSLIISPNFANDNTLYVYTAKGVLKSTDGGKNWNSVNLLEKYDLQLAISPDYANDQTLFASSNVGLFKTEDEGNTWTPIPIANLPKDPYLEGVAISPNYPKDKTVMVSVRGKGIYKSVDGGQNFQSVGDINLPYSRMQQVPSSGLALRFSPNYAQDNTIFSFGSAQTALYKSADGGNNWENLPVTVNPVPMLEQYDLPTSVNLWFTIYRARIVIFLEAAFIALLAYFLAGLLHLEKKLPLSKIQVKLLACILLFSLSLLVLNYIELTSYTYSKTDSLGGVTTKD